MLQLKGISIRGRVQQGEARLSPVQQPVQEDKQLNNWAMNSASQRGDFFCGTFRPSSHILKRSFNTTMESVCGHRRRSARRRDRHVQWMAMRGKVEPDAIEAKLTRNHSSTAAEYAFLNRHIHEIVVIFNYETPGKVFKFSRRVLSETKNEARKATSRSSSMFMITGWVCTSSDY